MHKIKIHNPIVGYSRWTSKALTFIVLITFSGLGRALPPLTEVEQHEFFQPTLHRLERQLTNFQGLTLNLESYSPELLARTLRSSWISTSFQFESLFEQFLDSIEEFRTLEEISQLSLEEKASLREDLIRLAARHSLTRLSSSHSEQIHRLFIWRLVAVYYSAYGRSPADWGLEFLGPAAMTLPSFREQALKIRKHFQEDLQMSSHSPHMLARSLSYFQEAERHLGYPLLASALCEKSFQSR